MTTTLKFMPEVGHESEVTSDLQNNLYVQDGVYPDRIVRNLSVYNALARLHFSKIRSGTGQHSRPFIIRLHIVGFLNANRRLNDNYISPSTFLKWPGSLRCLW